MSTKDASRLNTRSTNVLQHPGEIMNQGKVHRRSSTEVQAEKEQKKRAAQEKEQKKKNGMAQAAALEQKALEKSKGQKNQLGVSSNAIPHVKRTSNQRPSPDLEEIPLPASDAAGSKRKRIKRIIYESASESDNAEPASGSEYGQQLGEHEDNEDSEDEDIEDIELEDDAPDTTLKTKGKGKGKTKKGVEKAKTKKTKANEAPSGVTRSWENDPLLHPRAHAQRSQSLSSQSSLAPIRTSNDVDVSDMALTDANTDYSAFQEGGISSDNDDIELQSLVKRGSKSASFRSLPAVKVEDLAETPTLLKRPSRSNSKAPSKCPTLKDLPPEASKFFDAFWLKGYDALGDLDAWSSLNDIQILTIWNEAAAEEFPIAGVDDEWFPIVKKLLSRSFSTNWTHKFREAGVMAVTEEFQRRGLESVEARKTFVKAMLGKEDQTSVDRPFLWQSTDDITWKGDTPEPKRSGVFLGRLVMITLAAHLTIISGLDADDVSKRPRGALMTAIQAVHRALLYAVSGEMKEPSGRGGGFSQENWGDIMMENQGPGLNGKSSKKIIKRGSIYKERLDDRPAKHWDLILTTAAGYVGKKKGVARAINMVEDDAAEMDDPEEAAAYNDALFDPMFDE